MNSITTESTECDEMEPIYDTAENTFKNNRLSDDDDNEDDDEHLYEELEQIIAKLKKDGTLPR
eukprot:Awhi_evm1s12204